MAARISSIDQQNIDIPAENPLKTEVVLKENPTTTPTPKDPKIKLLIILGIILVVLLIFTIAAVIIRNSVNKPINYQPAPTPAKEITPTEEPTELPPEWANKLDKAYQETEYKEEFLPPQIDSDIGL